MTDLKTMAKWFYPWLLVWGALEFAFGVGLIAVAETVDLRSWLSALVRDAGLALLITALLTLTFERVTRERFEKEINRAAHRLAEAQSIATWKGAIPPAIFEQMRDSVIREACLRTDYRLSINLTHEAEDSEYLLMAYSGYFSVVNKTEHEARFVINIFVEKYLDGLFPGRSRVTSMTIEKGGSVQRFGQQELSEPGVVKDKGTYFELKHPLLLEPGETARVTSTFEAVRYSRDYWYWVMTHVTERLELTVKYPDDIEVEAFAVHPDKDRKFREIPAMGSGLKQWELEAGLLPYQGVEIRWQPVE